MAQFVDIDAEDAITEASQTQASYARVHAGQSLRLQAGDSAAHRQAFTGDEIASIAMALLSISEMSQANWVKTHALGMLSLEQELSPSSIVTHVASHNVQCHYGTRNEVINAQKYQASVTSNTFIESYTQQLVQQAPYNTVLQSPVIQHSGGVQTGSIQSNSVSTGSSSGSSAVSHVTGCHAQVKAKQVNTGSKQKLLITG